MGKPASEVDLRSWSLSIYNVLEQRVEAIFDGSRSRGEHSIHWTAGRYPSVIYLVRVKMGELTETERLLILK
ncbi:MAG: hypothetical protein CO189_11485 [candidate division Zixibacteria bacterium CG_4_9_14_3_um_filter_46_8]|nr:MAG: hypothetical protein CO189_11485 [candidate division Zixibacteria bacterium CG_4_9_14_3_um_filter_46_8]